MILHIDDRLLHGRILHGWDRGRAKRFVLISRRLADPAIRELYAQAAGKPTVFLPMAGEDPAPEEKGDFWLADHPAAAAYLLEKGVALEALWIIALRQGGEFLRPDLTPDGVSLALLDDLRSRGLSVAYRPFLEAEAVAWPPC